MNAMVLPVLAALLAFGAVMLVSLAVVDTQRRAGMRRSLTLALGDPLSQPAVPAAHGRRPRRSTRSSSASAPVS